MTLSTTFVMSGDRTPLFVRDFAAAREDAPTLILIHGACEHGERYRHVAEEFARSGWRVIVPDLRGHGRSGGTSMFVANFDEYLSDIDAMYDRFGLDPEHTAMLGHSMGGLIVTRFAQTRPNRPAAVVLSSPLFRVKVNIPKTTIAIGKLLSVVVPRFRFRSRVSVGDVTRNEQTQRERRNDPYIRRSVTAGWFFAMQRAMREAWQQSGDVQTPVLIVQAGDDRIVDPLASQSWFDSLSVTNRRMHVVPGGYHELFNELDWRETIALIIEWLNENVCTAASAD